MCNCPTTEGNIQNTETWLKLKILWKIFGPTKEVNSICRIKTNTELDELIKHQNTINYVKAQRLSWFGHINRMPETGRVKIYTNGNHSQVRQQEGTSPTGKMMSRMTWRRWSLWGGQNKSRTALNGSILSRRQRLDQSCSATEEDWNEVLL